MMFIGSLSAGAACVHSAIAFGAAAQSIEIRCERSAARSRASVDGHGLAQASCNAVPLSSGDHAQSIYEPARDGEVAFLFDSQVSDDGTPIPPNFIVHNRVRAAILDVNGDTVVKGGAACRRK